MKDQIDKKFYGEDKHPRANTVGDLKTLLKELPDNLKISTNWNKGCALVVFNIDIDKDQPHQEERHLSFCDTEEY